MEIENISFDMRRTLVVCIHDYLLPSMVYSHVSECMFEKKIISRHFIIPFFVYFYLNFCCLYYLKPFSQRYGTTTTQKKHHKNKY